MMKSAVLTAVVLGALTLPAHAQIGGAACRLFGNEASDDGKQFYELDPATGVGSVIGDPGQAVTGMAFHPVTGLLYGSTATIDIAGSTIDICHLITIDPLTGKGTDIGSFGLSDETDEGCTLADLTFDPATKTLYGWRSRRQGDLYTVNLQTGAATKVGESGLSDLQGGGLAFGPGGKLFLAAEGTEGKLRTINKTTGLPIDSVDLTGYGKQASIAALAYDGRFLFGVTRKDGDLIRINPNTGEIETIGPAASEQAAIDALAFPCAAAGISAPATSARTLVFLALALVAMGTWHNRSRRRGSRAAT